MGTETRAQGFVEELPKIRQSTFQMRQLMEASSSGPFPLDIGGSDVRSEFR